MRSQKGSLKEIKKGLWRVVVEFPRHEDGSRNQVKRHVRGTRKDALAVQMELFVQAGEDVQSEMLLGQYCTEVYLPAKKGELKPSAYQAYYDRIHLHVIPGLGDVPLADLTPAMIRRWIASKDSPAVQRECRKMLHMVCQHAVYDDHLKSNPVSRVRPPKVERYEPEVLDAEDVAVYLWHFRGMRSEPFVLVAMGCGLRRGEIVALDVSDVNPKTGAIRVDSSVVQVKGGPVEGVPKTHASIRTVHLPEPFLSRLLEILPPDGPICRTLDGGRLTPSSVTHLYLRELSLLPEGVPRVSLKNLRHTSLTLAYDATGDIMAAKERAGHTNVSITTQYYVRPTGERDRAAAERIAERLSGV